MHFTECLNKLIYFPQYMQWRHMVIKQYLSYSSLDGCRTFSMLRNKVFWRFQDVKSGGVLARCDTVQLFTEMLTHDAIYNARRTELNEERFKEVQKPIIWHAWAAIKPT